MEMTELDLPTGEIGQDWYKRDTPTQAIITRYTWEFKHTLSELLVQPSFDAASVVPAMLDEVDEATPSIVADVVRSEPSYDDLSHSPVKRLLGELAISLDDVSGVRLNENFVENIRQQVEDLDCDFSPLSGWHEELKRSGYLDLVREVHENIIWRKRQGNPNDYVDEVYEWVKEAAFDPEKYRLPGGVEQALFLITFMPGEARSLTRRIITNNVIMDTAERLLGDDPGEEDQLFLQKMREYHAIDAVISPFYENSQRRKLSEAHNVEFALYSARQVELLGELQAMHDAHKGTKTEEAWLRATERLDQTIHLVSDNDVYHWAPIDTGHCFQGFRDLDLCQALLYSSAMRRELSSPEKTDRRAVILEDDPKQMSAWQVFVDKRTTFNLDADLCFEQPDGIEALAADLSCGLFMIDIQNGNDPFAGIQLGNAILQKRFEAMKAYPGGLEAAPKTEIIIWSSSPELVDEASKHLEPWNDALRDDERRYVDFSSTGGGNHSSSCSTLSVNIRVKRLGLLDTSR